jgi:hypothetical protein
MDETHLNIKKQFNNNNNNNYLKYLNWDKINERLNKNEEFKEKYLKNRKRRRIKENNEDD